MSRLLSTTSKAPESGIYGPYPLGYSSTMNQDLIRKLASELDAGIATEVQVVYALAGIRKLIERDKIEEKYAALKFYCDWALHSSMDRAAAKAILKQFDAAHLLLRGNIKLSTLPSNLRVEIDRITQMRSFKKELSQFLAAYGLPPLTQHRSDGWIHFLHLYVKVVEDTPLVVSLPTVKKKPKRGATDGSPKHISHVIVHFESARETLKHGDAEDVLFKVRWSIHDKNGQSGDIFILNTFSLEP